jgi:TRAP-type mannitol/chloroaromatic compound transport system substrate-binding protein
VRPHPVEFYVGKDPTFAFDSCLPFGPQRPPAERLDAAWRRARADPRSHEGVQHFSIPAGNTGAQMGGWFRKEINTVADLQGLKMRIRGLPGR